MDDRIVHTLEQTFYKHISRSTYYMFQFAHIRIFKGFNPTLPKDHGETISLASTNRLKHLSGAPL